MASKCIIIFTDGSSLGNPGRGGWGCIIQDCEGKVIELGGAVEHATNNEMELRAAFEALFYIKDMPGNVCLYSDSSYLTKGITSWIHGWKNKNWITTSGDPVSNRDLWLKIDHIVSERTRSSHIDWQHISGHKGIPGNERVDELASSFAENISVDLYHGTKDGYFVDLNMDLVDIKKIAKEKNISNKRKKTRAFSYVSLLNGQIIVHKTWDECKKRVSGKANVKYKKSISKEDEEEIKRKFSLLID